MGAAAVRAVQAGQPLNEQPARLNTQQRLLCRQHSTVKQQANSGPQANQTLHRALCSLCRIPADYLVGTKSYVGPGVADTPLIVFINAKSGGRVGPRLLTVLFRSLGTAQVVRVLASPWLTSPHLTLAACAAYHQQPHTHPPSQTPVDRNLPRPSQGRGLCFAPSITQSPIPPAFLPTFDRSLTWLSRGLGRCCAQSGTTCWPGRRRGTG